MRKKVLALGLCAAMAASSLAGCSSSDSGSGNAGNEAAGGAALAGTEAPAAGGAGSQELRPPLAALPLTAAAYPLRVLGGPSFDTCQFCRVA